MSTPKPVKLRGLSGSVVMASIACNDEFPAIVLIPNSKRAFYKVGTLKKGTVGLYEECQTAEILCF